MNCGYVLGDTLRSYVATVTIPYTVRRTTYLHRSYAKCCCWDRRLGTIERSLNRHKRVPNVRLESECTHGVG